MLWSYAAKSRVKLLIKVQNSTVRQILDKPWYVRNFHIYKEIDIPCFTDFMQHLNFNFYLALENMDNCALDTLVEYDYNNPINTKRPKTYLHLNTLL